jgi:hypothetical protein
MKLARVSFWVCSVSPREFDWFVAVSSHFPRGLHLVHLIEPHLLAIACSRSLESFCQFPESARSVLEHSAHFRAGLFLGVFLGLHAGDTRGLRYVL